MYAIEQVMKILKIKKTSSFQNLLESFTCTRERRRRTFPNGHHKRRTTLDTIQDEEERTRSEDGRTESTSVERKFEDDGKEFVSLKELVETLLSSKPQYDITLIF